MSRVLVTGGGGQLAADLVAAWSDAEVLAPPRPQLDVTDGAAVERFVRDAQPDLVLHAAAWTDVDGAYGARIATEHLLEQGHRRLRITGLSQR